jgi:PKD repeat protein
MPLTGSTVAELEVGPGSDQVLKVDEDGDGRFETRKSPDVTFSDSDGDGLPDAWESQYGTQVNIPDAGDDPDGDGLTNYEEYMWGSDPLNPDTDADGVFDSLDVCHGYDDSVDSDGDGIPDGCDVSLVIGNVEVSVLGNSATISWDTDRLSDSLVKYGTEFGVYNWQEYDASLVTSHEVTLTELQAGKKYYYVVCSTDEGGNPSESNEYDFTTLALPIQLPVASFTVSPADPFVNDEITFNASASRDPDGGITNYEWDFGDGSTVSTTKEVIQHTYHSAGDYRVNLTLTDNDGATDSSNKIIHVSAKPEVTTYDYNISGTVEAWSTGDYDPKADYANLNFNPDHKPFGELLIDWETKSSWAQIHRLDVYDRTADIVVKTTGWNQMGLGRSGQYKWNLSTLVTNFSHDHSIRTWVSSGTVRVPTDIRVKWNVVEPVVR